MTTQAEAEQVKAKIKDKLFQDPNVNSIAVVEEISPLGKKTGNYIIEVGVVSSEASTHDITDSSSILSDKFELSSIDPSLKGIKVVVIETGDISALREMPSALDDIPPALTGGPIKARSARPSVSGDSIGHENVTAGTLGLLVQYEDGFDKQSVYILSNNHVLANNNEAHIGDHIVQPGPHDKGKKVQDTIAYLDRWVPLNFSGVNYVDVALAKVSDLTLVQPILRGVGRYGSVTYPKTGMDVLKVGRTTGITEGIIHSINAAIKVRFAGNRHLEFDDQIITTGMSRGGDSGSVLVEKNSLRPVGLLFAGSISTSYHNKMSNVLSKLPMAQTSTSLSGNSTTFGQSYPLKVFTDQSPHGRIEIFFRSAGNYRMRYIAAAVATATSLVTFGLWKAKSPRENNKTHSSEQALSHRPTPGK